MVPTPPLPPVEPRESPFVRFIRQLDQDNGARIYECELETARQTAAHWEQDSGAAFAWLLHQWDPLPFITAQAIFTTTMRRDPELLRRRRKEFGIDELFRRYGRKAVRHEAES
jgi:hypothetical protein